MDDIGTRAEQLTRRRARAMPVFAILLITQQGAFVGHGAPDRIRIAAWLVISIVLLLFLTTGGGWTRGRAIRALMNDETTRAHRARALSLGFSCTMATGIVLYVASLFKPVAGREAVHVMMTVGIAGALIAFATAERRALGN